MRMSEPNRQKRCLRPKSHFDSARKKAADVVDLDVVCGTVVQAWRGKQFGINRRDALGRRFVRLFRQSFRRSTAYRDGNRSWLSFGPATD
jgi:hypothetical protein